MKIKWAKFVTSAVFPDQYVKDDKPEIVLLGRSNVGKSSLINSIANNKKLAYVSSKPGKTQTINFYNMNNEFYFVDLPGYGYAGVLNRKKDYCAQMIETYLNKNKENIAGAFMLLDIRLEPSSDDELMWQWLKYHNIKTGFVATKADKISNSEIEKRLIRIKECLKIPEYITIIPFSSVNGQGKEQVLMAVEEALEVRDDIKV